MNKIKKVKNWKIKEPFLKKMDGVPGILFKALNEDLTSFGHVNQAVGSIINAGCEEHLQTLFETYSTYGIWLSENKAVYINFKTKKGEQAPGYC